MSQFILFSFGNAYFPPKAVSALFWNTAIRSHDSTRPTSLVTLLYSTPTMGEHSHQFLKKGKKYESSSEWVPFLLSATSGALSLSTSNRQSPDGKRLKHMLVHDSIFPQPAAVTVRSFIWVFQRGSQEQSPDPPTQTPSTAEALSHLYSDTQILFLPVVGSRLNPSCSTSKDIWDRIILCYVSHSVHPQSLCLPDTNSSPPPPNPKVAAKMSIVIDIYSGGGEIFLLEDNYHNRPWNISIKASIFCPQQVVWFSNVNMHPGKDMKNAMGIKGGRRASSCINKLFKGNFFGNLDKALVCLRRERRKGHPMARNSLGKGAERQKRLLKQKAQRIQW